MWFHLRLLEKCNLRCKSCYAQEHDRSDIMDFETFKDVLTTIKKVKIDHQMSVIYLSGGEPLLHPEFLHILDHCFSMFDWVSILTNGLLVPEYIDYFIPYRDKLCVQVSLDGDPKTNDRIRGTGVFAKAVHALQILEQYQIRHWLSYTVSQLNKSCYKDVLNVAKQTHSLFNNVTPYTGDPDEMLSYYEWKEFKYLYGKYAKEIGIAPAHGPHCCGFSYHCGSFVSGVTINPDGSLAGCARLNNIKGYYKDMNKFLEQHPLSIAETCMKPKWGGIPNFSILTRLECKETSVNKFPEY